MKTRTQFLAKECSFAEYYGDIIEETGYRAPRHMVDRARSSQDPHFNDIPLRQWDGCVPIPVPIKINQAFRARGDYPTLAGLVCLVKEAVRREIKGG